jgi:hypothetical protein
MAIVSRFREPRTRWIIRGVLSLLAVYCVVVLALMWWWSYEPEQFDVSALSQQRASSHQEQLVTGSVVTSTLMGCAETLLDKRGGYISNDKFPPGLFMDNVPNWEFGVLTATRDLASELRNRFSRSQSQSERSGSAFFQSERSLAATEFRRPVPAGDRTCRRLFRAARQE